VAIVKRLMELTSAGLGVIGTLILFRHSYALEPYQGNFGFFNPVDAKENQRITAERPHKLRMQRIGLKFLIASFALQALAVFIP
jgi:hypothetical protein